MVLLSECGLTLTQHLLRMPHSTLQQAYCPVCGFKTSNKHHFEQQHLLVSTLAHMHVIPHLVSQAEREARQQDRQRGGQRDLRQGLPYAVARPFCEWEPALRRFLAVCAGAQAISRVSRMYVGQDDWQVKAMIMGT